MAMRACATAAWAWDSISGRRVSEVEVVEVGLETRSLLEVSRPAPTEVGVAMLRLRSCGE